MLREPSPAGRTYHIVPSLQDPEGRAALPKIVDLTGILQLFENHVPFVTINSTILDVKRGEEEPNQSEVNGCINTILKINDSGRAIVDKGTVFWRERNQLPKTISEEWDCVTLINLWDRRLMRQSCLLYTSPSPRDRQKSRMPSSA